MTNRQRLGIFLVSSALVGGFSPPLLAYELPLPPIGTIVPAAPTHGNSAQSAPQAAKPAHTVSVVTKRSVSLHRIHRATAVATSAPPRLPVPMIQPELIEIASSAPQPNSACRIGCFGPLVLGVTY
jgi:hypothetical protein